MSEPQPLTPLAGRSPLEVAGVRLAEAAFRGKAVLRLAEADAGRAGDALGLPLPLAPLTAAFGDGVAAARLGPDEWFLLAAADRQDALVAALETALADRHAAVVDVSHRLGELTLDGAGWRDLLAAGCPLDLAPAVTRPGFTGRSLLGKCDIVLLVRAEDAATLFVERSFAAYAFSFLAASGGAVA